MTQHECRCEALWEAFRVARDTYQRMPTPANYRRAVERLEEFNREFLGQGETVH